LWRPELLQILMLENRLIGLPTCNRVWEDIDA
jgi:hypothetical protein